MTEYLHIFVTKQLLYTIIVIRRYWGDCMSKKEKKKVKSQFEYDCYLRDKPYYIMIKYGFYIAMFFTVITHVYGIVCIYMEFILHTLIVKEVIMLILLSIIFISAMMFTIGNIVFEIAFRKQIKNYS